jgi:hypothetical protein
MTRLNSAERTTLTGAILEHLQEAAREYATGDHNGVLYLDSLIDVNPAVGPAEDVTMRDALRMLRKGSY